MVAADMPTIIISIDFELGWGFISNPQHKEYISLKEKTGLCYEKTAQLLEAFYRYKIPATWAVVGNLLLDKQETMKFVPPNSPQFIEGWLDWEKYINFCGEPLFFARDIIEMINSSPVGHEIASHSFSHMQFSKCSEAVARSELELVCTAFKLFGYQAESLVYPYDKIGHVDILAEYGFKIFRGKTPYLWDENKLDLLNYANVLVSEITSKPAKVISQKYGVVELGGSLHFGDQLLRLPGYLKAKKCLQKIIKNNGICHVWLHDRDYIIDAKILDDFIAFLSILHDMAQTENLKIVTMSEFARQNIFKDS